MSSEVVTRAGADLADGQTTSDEGPGAENDLADGQTSGYVGPGAGNDLADGKTSGDVGPGARDDLADGQTTGDVGPGASLMDCQTSSDEGASLVALPQEREPNWIPSRAEAGREKRSHLRNRVWKSWRLWHPKL